MSEKKCPKCGETKPIDAFCIDRSRKDGRRGRCRECDARQDKKYRSDPANREKEAARAKRWADANRERATARMRRWVEQNRDKHRESGRQSRQRNPDAQRNYEARWYAKYGTVTKRRYRMMNRPRFRAYSAKRRAQKRDTMIGPVDYAVIAQRDQNTCYLCGQVLTDEQITIDHVIPLSRQGTHTEDNLRVACWPCNLRKNKYLLSELRWYIPR